MRKPAIVIYARRSSDRDDLQVASINQQLDALRQLAAKRGLDVSEELIENASAKDPGRPIFAELTKKIRAGRVQSILVWRLDRLARNMLDGGQIIYELTEGHLKEIITPEATYTDSGDSKFMLAMLFGAAAKYTDDLSAAVRRGNQAVIRKGKVPGPVPLGYLKTHEHELAPGSGTVIPDPERFEAVKRVWKEVLGGETNLSEIWRKARTEWGLTTRPTAKGLAHPVALAQIYTILRNPFYTGKVFRHGESYRGEHPPMVTWEEFQRVQGMIAKRDRKQPEHHTHEFLYQGLIHCGHCKRGLTGEHHEKGTHSYIYYRCSRRRPDRFVCHAKAVTEDQVTEALMQTFEQVVIDPTIRDWAFQAVAWWAGQDEPSPDKLVKRAKAALAREEQRLSNLTDLVLGEYITKEEYQVRRMNQLARIDHLREALADPIQKARAWRELRDEKRQNGLKLGQEFQVGDRETKRRIVQRTCSAIIVTDGKPVVELKTPFVLRLASPDSRSGLDNAKEGRELLDQENWLN